MVGCVCCTDLESIKYCINKILHAKKPSDLNTRNAIEAGLAHTVAQSPNYTITSQNMTHIVLENTLRIKGHGLKRSYNVSNSDIEDKKRTFIMYCKLRKTFKCRRFTGYTQSVIDTVVQQLVVVKNAVLHSETIHTINRDCDDTTKKIYVKLPVKSNLTLVHNTTDSCLLTTDTSCIRDIVAVYEVVII